MTTTRLLARNSLLNLFGHAAPIIIGVAAIPPLVRGLGAERFGILSLAWAAIGYFSLFEMGLSRALTQAVAQRLGNGEKDQLSNLTWTALLLLFALGAVGAIVVAVLAPTLVIRVLNVPPWLHREAITSFRILAASLPFVVTSVGLRGIMEAHQHFGVATALRVPLVAVMFLGPLLVLPFSSSLVPAIWILAAARASGFIAHLVCCLWLYPFFRQFRVRGAPVVSLLRYGAWTTVSNVTSPMMVFLDRFLVGALLPLAAVAHYVTPYEVVTKLLVIPIGVVTAVFPAFASTVTSDRKRMAQLYDRSLRAIILSLFPLALIAIAIAKEGLSLWVGPMLPHDSVLVVKWLAVGVFINGIAQPPLVALQSATRPDIVAKLHVLELPLYIVGILVLVQTFGLQGVAIAWTLRVTIDAVALLAFARRYLGLSMTPRPGGAASLLIMVAALGVAAALESAQARLVYLALGLTAFAPLAWLAMMTSVERTAIRQWLGRPTTVRSEGAV